MKILNRIINISQGEIHALIDRFEDPVKMSEQAIRNLENDLERHIKALALLSNEVVKIEKLVSSDQALLKRYEDKIEQLIKLTSDNSNDELIKGLMIEKKNVYLRLNKQTEAYSKLQNETDYQRTNTNVLRENLRNWKQEVQILKAKAISNHANKTLFQNLSGNSSSSLDTLERMKNKSELTASESRVYQEFTHNDVKTSLLESDSALDEELEKLRNEIKSKEKS